MTKEREELLSTAKDAQRQSNIEGQKLWAWKEFVVALLQSNRDIHLTDVGARADALTKEWLRRRERVSYFEEKNDKAWEAVHAAEPPVTVESSNEPNTIIDKGVKSRALAWAAVAKLLTEIDPMWLHLAPTAQEAALLAIGQLKNNLDRCQKRMKKPV